MRYHTHTDHLRHRIGGAVGRTIIRGINSWRRKRGKSEIPLRGSWTGGNGGGRGRGRSGSKGPARGGRSKPKPVKVGSGMTVYPRGTKPKQRRLPGGTYMTGQALPKGARGGGLGGGGGFTPGPAGGRPGQLAGRPRPTGGTAPGPTGGRPSPATGPAPSGGAAAQTTATVTPITTAPGANTPGAAPAPPAPSGAPTTSTTGTSTGGNPMSQPTSGGGYGGMDGLGEAPETDAVHAQWAEQFAQDLGDLGERLREHRELLEGEVNMHASVMAGLDEAAEHLSEAASGVTNHAQDYMSTYEGVRETAAATEGHIPGMDPNSGYWSETA